MCNAVSVEHDAAKLPAAALRRGLRQHERHGGESGHQRRHQRILCGQRQVQQFGLELGIIWRINSVAGLSGAPICACYTRARSLFERRPSGCEHRLIRLQLLCRRSFRSQAAGTFTSRRLSTTCSWFRAARACRHSRRSTRCVSCFREIVVPFLHRVWSFICVARTGASTKPGQRLPGILTTH